MQTAGLYRVSGAAPTHRFEGLTVRRSFGNNETLSVAAMCVSKKTFVCKGFFRLCAESRFFTQLRRKVVRDRLQDDFAG
jgi:hypothetical protein